MVFDTGCKVGAFSLDKFVAGHMLVKLDVAFGYAFDKFRSHLWDSLTFLAHEVVVDEPLANKLFAELTLFLPFLETFLIAVGIEISGRVGSVDLVYKHII